MPRTNENRVKSNNSTLTFASDHETVNLVTIQNNRAVTSSLQVAEYFNALNFEPVKFRTQEGERRKMSFIYCAFKKMMYLCSATVYIQALQESCAKRVESICGSIITHSYISDVCDCRKLGLCGTAFLFNHLNATVR